MSQDASVQNSVPSPKGQRIAVVVGVNGSTSFRDKPSLKHACDDANAIAEVLEQRCDFDVLDEEVIGEYASSNRIMRAIFKLSARRGKDDFLLFYFSGHGIPVDLGKRYTDVYLVSSDFDLDEVYRHPGMHISLKWLREQLYTGTDAGYVLMIIDCCHAGGISLAAPDRTIEQLVEKLLYG